MAFMGLCIAIKTLIMEYRMWNDDKCEYVFCFVCRIHDEDHYLAKTIFENEMCVVKKQY